MVISKEDKKLLEEGINLLVSYDYDSGGVYIDEDEIREEFENKLEELLEIGKSKCGFCGESLEEDTTYCSSECYRPDITECV